MSQARNARHYELLNCWGITVNEVKSVLILSDQLQYVDLHINTQEGVKIPHHKPWRNFAPC
jgi:hypothetical protein